VELIYIRWQLKYFSELFNLALESKELKCRKHANKDSSFESCAFFALLAKLFGDYLQRLRKLAFLFFCLSIYCVKINAAIFERL